MHLGDLEKLIQMYNMIAHDLNFNMSQILPVSNASHSQRLMSNAKVIWRSLGPIICGSPQRKDVGYTPEDNNDGNLGEGSSVSAVKFALYALTNDPKILYAPNGTEADKVIAKVIQSFSSPSFDLFILFDYMHKQTQAMSFQDT